MEDIQINLTPALLIHFISVLPVAFACGITFRNYTRTRYRHALYLSFVWFFMSLNIGLVALARLLESIPILIIGRFSWLAFGYFLIRLFDSVSREKLEPVKFIIWSLLAGMIVILTFNLPEETMRNILDRIADTPLEGIYLQYQIFWTINAAFMAFITVYYCARIWVTSPRKLRKKALVMMLGAIIMAPISVLILAIDPEAIYEVSMSIGAFILAMVMLSEPKLAFILPYRVLKLVVIESGSGIPLFTHSWKKDQEETDLDLFSGVFHGIGLLIKDTIQIGELSCIRVEEAILIVARHKTAPIASVIVASKPSEILRTTLREFTNRFVREYKDLLGKVPVIGPFRNSTMLLSEVFPFVPEYDQGEYDKREKTTGC